MARTIDKRRTCAECGKKGATRAGLCLGCVVAILADREPKSARGRAYLKEFLRRAAAGEAGR